MKIEQQLKIKAIELLEEHFPKGNKGRGTATVLIALLLYETLKIIKEEKWKQKTKD